MCLRKEKGERAHLLFFPTRTPSPTFFPIPPPNVGPCIQICSFALWTAGAPVGEPRKKGWRQTSKKKLGGGRGNLCYAKKKPHLFSAHKRVCCLRAAKKKDSTLVCELTNVAALLLSFSPFFLYSPSSPFAPPPPAPLPGKKKQHQSEWILFSLLLLLSFHLHFSFLASFSCSFFQDQQRPFPLLWLAMPRKMILLLLLLLAI